MCRNKSDRTSCIELSPKVCSTPDRVRDTLVHEMCHAAVWVVDGRIKEGHGAVWKKWAYMCMKRFSFLPVIGRCHDYEIDAKFIYECEGCGQQLTVNVIRGQLGRNARVMIFFRVRRHTKSFDTTRKICGICKARFVLQVRPNAKNKAPNNELQHNSFAKYVKENYGKYKKPGMKHGEVMRTLAQLYKEQSMQRISEEETKLQDKSTRKINKEEAEVQDLLDLSVLSIHN
ncbi:hypothetical protein NECAME_13230 [Necator americanus]|uniref:SprT-like domain-containing protein n=1 Tax=Necator americanus TaxID=51031 RepID=W2SZB7_NECAM|nr:hypothetical protein NECAME_13230 [Necator americanus]ETN74047.1 hypothetical protein NECAME_13230 [Necator americanus]